jgi:expansin (peptidoglycan-binding protein)
MLLVWIRLSMERSPSVAQIIIAALFACLIVAAQDSREVIAVASRSGIVHLIDPATLQTIGQIQISLAPGSAGLNGISAGVGGSTLYVEGPLPSDPRGCCVLYTIDLTTLQAKVAAGIPGSDTRNSRAGSSCTSRQAVGMMNT